MIINIIINKIQPTAPLVSPRGIFNKTHLLSRDERAFESTDYIC